MAAGFTVAVLAACGSFQDGDSPPVKDAGGDAPIDGGGTTTPDAAEEAEDAGKDGGPLPPFCQRTANKAFTACDDFEDGVLLNPPWEPQVERQTVSASVVSLVSPSGDGFVHVAMPTVDETSAAFIRHVIGKPVKPQLTFGMTLQVAGFDAMNDYVEIAVLNKAGGGPAGGVAYNRGQLTLFVTDGPSTPINGSATTRRRIVITATLTKIAAHDGAGNLLAELSGDAGTLFSATGLELALGVYYTAKCKAGTIDIDDVIIDY